MPKNHDAYLNDSGIDRDPEWIGYEEKQDAEKQAHDDFLDSIRKSIETTS